MSRIGSAQECPASHQDIPVRSTSSITCCARTSLLETLAWPKSGIVGFFVHQVRLRLGPPLPALPTHYVKIKDDEIFGHFVLASRQAQTHPGDPSFGRLHVRRVDLQDTDIRTEADRQGQTGRGKQTEANRQTQHTQTSTYTEVSVQYSPSLCGEKDSNRHLRRGSTRPCQRCLFNISRACAGKWILTDIFEVTQRSLQTDSSSSRGV